MIAAAFPTVFAVTDFWMARWLTPVWFLGVGVTAGLAILALLLGIFYVMSKIPFLDTLRRTGAAHWIAAIATLAMSGLYTAFVYSTLSVASNNVNSDEVILLGLASLIFFGIVSWAVMYCSSTRFMMEVRSLLFEGIGLFLVSTLGIIALIGLACTPLADNPAAAFASVPKLFYVGTTSQSFAIPGVVSDDDAPFTKIPVKYDPSTLEQVEIISNQNLLIGDGPSIAEFRSPGFRVEREVPIRWNRTMGLQKSPLPLAAGSDVYVQNQEFGEANVEIRLSSAAPVRQATTFVLVAIFTVIFGLLFMLMQAVSPKTAAIALSAAKSELSQPLPVILMLIVALAILLFVFLPFHTFGEDIKLLKDCGITLILIAATFQAVWSASTSVNEEIEGRTALTLLSKPIHRRSFIIGKMLGIFWIVMFMFLVLGYIELLAVAYKPIYDARESSLEQPIWQQCHFDMMQTIPGLAMAFFQAVVLGAISVALGTRLPLVANFTICFAIYLLGHLTPTIVASAEGGLPLVEFFSQLISTVVPNLNLFSMEAAIDSDVGVPWVILASVLVYTTLYFVLATLLGLLLFEDRDLA
jgi:ABC-type transport system involved in multi-copper enzyme maturation permease subunit